MPSLGAFRQFLATNKKWWLTPICVILLLGVLILLGGTITTPFTYTLF